MVLCMRLAIARFLAVIMLCSAAAPAFADAGAAAMHAIGCDTHLVATHSDDMAQGEHRDHRANGLTDKMRVCPLSASCLPGLIGDDLTVVRLAHGALAPVKPTGERAVSALLSTLDPPPPRRA